MSTERVYIAQLRKWFVIDTADIEKLIDAVTACDNLNVSGFCRVDPSGTNRIKPFQEEWNGTWEEWKRRRIDSEKAKEIAKKLEDVHTEKLFGAHEEVLGEVHSDTDPEDRDERLTRKVNAIKYHPDIYFDSTVYYMFLDVLLLNLDDALKHIASTHFIMRAGIPEDIARRVRAFAEAANGAQAGADQPTATNNNSAISQPPSEPFAVTRRYAESPKKTREKNSVALQYIAYWKDLGESEEDIAKKLKEATSDTVIACLMADEKENLSSILPESMAKRGRRLRGK